MKKIIIFLSVLFLSILLTGCISIPIGDGGKLEVSKDGLNVDVGEEDESNSEGSEDTEVSKENSEDEDADVNTTDEGAEEEKSGDTASKSDSCLEPIEDPRGNERLIKQLEELAPPDFPISDCIIVESANESYSDTYEAVVLESYFVVEGYWADVYDIYKDYLGESEFTAIRKNENAQNMSATLEGKTPDYEVSMQFNQMKRDDDLETTKVWFKVYHYDTPRDE